MLSKTSQFKLHSQLFFCFPVALLLPSDARVGALELLRQGAVRSATSSAIYRSGRTGSTKLKGADAQSRRTQLGTTQCISQLLLRCTSSRLQCHESSQADGETKLGIFSTRFTLLQIATRARTRLRSATLQGGLVTRSKGAGRGCVMMRVRRLQSLFVRVC